MRLGYAYQKGGFFVDESLLIAISTRGHIPQLERGEYFGKDLKQNAYFNDNSLRDLAHDLGELWKNNYGDGAAHPNLYYILLRIWNFDVKSGDFAWLKARGIGLNLVFFAFAFYTAFILMSKIFSHTSLIVPLFLALAFWNSASVTNTIFIRPYALQEMLLLIFALNCFVFYRLDFVSAKEAFTRHKLFFAWFIFATGLLCLSHYFSLFFIAFAFVFLALISRKNIFPLSLVVLGSFAIAQIFYRGYFSEVIGGHRAKESTEKLFLSNFWQNLEQSFKAGVDILQAHFCNFYGFSVLCAVCAIALIFWQTQSRFTRPKTPKFAFDANLKVFFAFIAKNTAKPYKKLFIILSALAIFAYIVAFVLIALAKDNTQSATIRLESINAKDLRAFAYTGKIFYAHKVFNAKSSRASKLIIESISWDKAIDSNAITITQIKNRYIDFSTTQDLEAIWGKVAKDLGQNPQIATLTYRVDFSPLLKAILRYYALLILLSFLIVFYWQYVKIAFGQAFSNGLMQEYSCESRKNATFLLGFFVIAFLWFAFVLFVAPYKDLRYVMSIFAFLYFGVVVAFSAVKKPVWQGILGVAFVASLFVNYEVKHLYKEPFIFSANPKLPTLVHLPTHSWQQGAFIFAFNDTQRYIVEPDSALLSKKMQEFDRFYLISEQPFETPNGYKQVAMQNEWYEYFYLFEK